MAAELIGGALFSSLFQVALDRLASADILDYFRGRKLNMALLQRLKVTLLAINVVIDDAENKQIKDLNIKRWVDEVKNAAYEAEDLLDEIDIEVSKQGQASKTSKVWKSLLASVSSFDKKIESRMEQVLANLENLESKKYILGLREGSSIGVGLGRMPDRSTTSLVDEAEIFGRNDEKEKIIECLLSDNVRGNCPYSVISVVAMGGMGKTTLAQLVYSDKRVESEFDVKAWVYVSEEFDVIRVTRTILEAITSSTDDTKDKNMLQHKLKEQLAGKKFLLVLDDVWNERYLNWEDLEKPFLDGVQGSKILVTSRSAKVANTMRSTEKILLNELREEDSWLLFSKHAFHGKNPNSNQSLEEIGRKIMKKCKGLPLALKTIGSLLCSKEANEEWNSILTSEIWDMSDDGGDILPALRLSYYYLPSNLKRCFAYCSLFPKGYNFDKEYLIWLWKGENLLCCSQNNKRVKEVGHHCFNELLTRSFFQYSKIHNYFIMHDLLCDLAKYVSGEFCFKFEEEEELPETISEKSRHFSFVATRRSRVAFNKQLETAYKANKIRTFLYVNQYCYINPFTLINSNLVDVVLSQFQCLRVLSFCSLDIAELPDSIGKLKPLRYLDLSLTKISKLPDSICLLYNLQILMLRNCKYLVELPSGLHKLVNLLYLDIEHTKVRKMPMHLGKLKKLQVLTSFSVGKSADSDILQLAELDLGGQLSISGLQNVVNPMDALAVNLKNKIHLDKLTLEWDGMDESERTRGVLEKLQPHQNLKELSIEKYGGIRFPNWFGDYSLQNLVFLGLDSCNCVLLPPLGVLPSLKTLYIKHCHSVVKISHEFHGDSSSSIPFRSLEMLTFDDMEGWEDWECKDVPGAFPVLQRLHIISCPRLKEQLPELLPSLKSLYISDCEKLVASFPHATAIREISIRMSCETLRTFSPDYFPQLQRLCFWDCPNFEMISVPEGDDPYDTFMTSLEISGCPKFASFPKRGLFAPRLEFFSIDGLENLKSLPEKMDVLLPYLRELWLVDCPQLELYPEGRLPSNLESLRISNCPRIEHLTKEHLSNLPSLKELIFKNCPRLECLLKECLCHLSSLKKLTLQHCPQLELFPEGALPSNLEHLFISSCSRIEEYLTKEHLCNLPSLKELYFDNCPRLKCLPKECLCHLSSLKELTLQKCQQLELFPEGGLPPNLKRLEIRCCPKLVASRMKWGLHLYISLETLTIEDHHLESFPDQGLLPRSLTVLSLTRCDNLRTLDFKGLCHLSSLTVLYLYKSPELKCLPKEGLPSSLSSLVIMSCSSLSKRCQKQKGEDWGKIAHIPQISIDDDHIIT